MFFKAETPYNLYMNGFTAVTISHSCFHALQSCQSPWSPLSSVAAWQHPLSSLWFTFLASFLHKTNYIHSLSIYLLLLPVFIPCNSCILSSSKIIPSTSIFLPAHYDLINWNKEQKFKFLGIKECLWYPIHGPFTSMGIGSSSEWFAAAHDVT